MLKPQAKPVGIAAAAVLVTSLLSVGQVRYDQRQAKTGDREAADVLAAGGESGRPSPGPVARPSGATGTGPGARSAPGGPSKRPGARSGTTVGGGPAGTLPTRVRPGQVVTVPDYGLRTQGVTPTSVKIGVDYNKSGCGDAGALEAALGPAVVGDPEKACLLYTSPSPRDS